MSERRSGTDPRTPSLAPPGGRVDRRSAAGAMRAIDAVAMRHRPGAREGRAETVIVQLAAFDVAGEHYAVDIMRIKEIINPLPIRRVPRSPSFIEGVIELRGAILPVIDLRKRFDAEATPRTRATKFLVASMQGAGGERDSRWIVGLVVDQVIEVIRIPRDEVRPAPAQTFGEASRYFSGVCRHRDRIAMVVELDQLLSPSERTLLAGLGESPLLPGAGLAEGVAAAGPLDASGPGGPFGSTSSHPVRDPRKER